MASSGAKPGRLPESALAIQIDTTLQRLETRANHGLQRFIHSFNRTVVMLRYNANNNSHILPHDAIYKFVILRHGAKI
jgi:hypothetical protein